jgi:hypothetical protein
MVGKSEETGTLGTCRSRRGDNIKIDIQVVGYEG